MTVPANKLKRDAELLRQEDQAEATRARYGMSGFNSNAFLRLYPNFYGEIRTLSVMRPTGEPKLAPVTTRLPRINVRGYCESLWFRRAS